MKTKKVVSILFLASLTVTSLAACSTGNKVQNGVVKDGVTTIEFWAAPNPTQQVYWKEVAEEFTKENPEINVNVSPMKESPTSEASIQSAIAGGSAPTMSENINRGFAAQLADSKALVKLDELNGWDKLKESRNMENTMEGWEFSDNHQYVMPIYSSPMLFGWRLDILEEIGVHEAPKTYSEMLDVAKKLKEKYPDKYVWAKDALADPTAWKRWFDFFMLYDAASNGNNFVEGTKFIGDEKAGEKVLGFVDDLRKEDALLTRKAKDPFESGLGIFTDIGPWTISYWKEKFPEMKWNETYTLAAPPVPDDKETSNVNTFADTKGLVVYASATKEQQEAAMKFINWVYSNPENDLKWFEKTNLPPARDDLTTNDTFKVFLDKNPELLPYAAAVPNAIPPMDNSKYNDIQTFIGQHAFNPVVKGEKDPKTAWKDMQEAIEGALK
ncbi:extracellular solute-binding protein [Peribacillus muralis]|uniref:extracellular solute-binding protein n=1 Tax=Peribacillus muralis TaxID=264697 RepID=UPI001F4D4931|nr:extracellular solute-binding protein [Peribacillus muralis]MCK1995003.1 extracellular solute-binding protein [Peribacillus muralis]MCK2015626.1 extracellular solute-binding protein [Peribacillus muralis]